jgi:RNA polymerase sigma-70 factor (ECF subfamily)
VTPNDATCWTLIRAAAAGDCSARDRFARLYEPIAQTYFATRWQRSPLVSSLDDAVQDVFVECFKDSGVLGRVGESPPDGFRAFFHGVLKNIARRHEEKQRPPASLSDDRAADDTSLARAFDRAWARSLLQEAARMQAETAAAAGDRASQRVELLRLRFQEGLPIRDIAARWNEDAAKLHHEYAVARDEFRAALKRVMAFHLPAASERELEVACRDVLGLLK